MALPAVLACLALCLGAVAGTAQYAGLVGAAAVAARLVGRGDDPGGAGGTVRDGAELAITRDGDLVCVSMTAANGGALAAIGVRLTARACALDEAVPP
ncbi:hypothetical protein [Leifsonia sp. SIMBA_070]|uniref:hypothetical protein n=1 Tax=Leifsonia sp. SIMBA_070 TaxID=3085810 RepID=UPI00397BCB66